MSLRLYEDELLPLYKLYSVEKTLSEALSRKVWLKCGGYIIIEQTEAMSVVDVNSGKNVTKAKKEADKENNILKTNIEEIFLELLLLILLIWHSRKAGINYYQFLRNTPD